MTNGYPSGGTSGSGGAASSGGGGSAIPPSPPQPETRTHAGAIGGLAAGGIIGAIIADGPGALVGMVIGAATGHHSMKAISHKQAATPTPAPPAEVVAQQVVHSWLGTIVGGTLGLLVAGPVGAVIGGGLGYVGRDSQLLDQQ